MQQKDFTQDLRTKLGTLDALHDVKFSDERLNDHKRRAGFTECVMNFLLSAAHGLSSGDFDYETKLAEYRKSSSVETAFARSMSEALVAGYFQALNNDVAKSGGKEFGFKGLGVAFERATMQYLAEIVADQSVSKSLETGLNVKLRTCSSKEYFDGSFWRDDIETLLSMLAADVDDGLNKSVLDALAGHEDVSSSINTYLDDIRAVYDLLFADSFGIEQYRGVLADGGAFLTIENGSNEASKIREGSLTLSKFADRVYQKLNGKVTISSKRQFDYDEIFSNKGVVYFPRKILEYALGRESTINQQSNYYRNSASSLSWESYSAAYVYKNIERVLYRGVYSALEKLLMESKSIKGNFMSQEFKSAHLNCDDFIREALARSGMYDRVLKMLSKVVQSIKSAYILTKYPCLAGKIAAIGFRICVKPSLGGITGDASSSSYLFKNLVAVNENEEFGAPVDIAGGRQSSAGVNASSLIYEFKYDINPMLTKAEPLFGYTIQRLNQAKGRSAGWSNILIGQSMSGKELYASKNSDIKMQNYFTHNIIAGSRSGKGVMTMNILANALAAGKPVFYLDRKPDMASMLHTLSGGSQFIVNGGLYQPDNDPDRRWSEADGPAMRFWREKAKPYLEANPLYAELLNVAPGASPSYYSVVGDYIYFRAFMFCLGICVLRTKLAGSSLDSMRTKDFNGNNGIVIVVDELTGFQSNIQNIFGNISSRMVQAALKIGDPKKIVAARQDLEAKIAVQEHKAQEATKESQRLQAEAEIDKLTRQLNDLIDEQGLYAATFYKKLCDSFQVLRENKVAGFKNKEFSFSDIFVLGQELTAKFYTSQDKGSLSPVFFTVKADNSNFYTDYQGADIVRSFIEELGQEDWFFGRNPDFNYAQKASDPAVIQCLDTDGNWEYAGSHSCKQVTGVVPDSFHHVLFKPYLVLNKHFENTPPTEVVGDGQYVAQCANRVNENAGGADLWSTVRQKHMAPGFKATPDNPQYNHLDEGLGFMGLIRDTLLTTPEGKKEASRIEEYVVEVLGRSGKIANIVADAMGYGCWEELIFDLSPEGLFGFNDMVNAVMHPDKYTMETRLPIHSMLGLINDATGSEPSASEPSERMGFDDMFGPAEEAGPERSDEIVTDSSGETEVSRGPQPVSHADRMSSAFWGEPEDEEVPETSQEDLWTDDSGMEEPAFESQPQRSSEEQPTHRGSSVDTSKILWANACTIVDMLIEFEAPDFPFSDDQIEELRTMAFGMLQRFMQEG